MFERKHKLLAPALAAGLAVTYAGAGIASADTIVVNGDPGDYDIIQDASDGSLSADTSADNLHAGQLADGNDHNMVFIFALPRIGSGNSVDVGTFGAQVTFKKNPNTPDTLRGDLMGIGDFPDSTDPILDFYEGSSTTSDPNGTLIKGAYDNPGSSGYNTTTGSTGGSQELLSTYLNSFYNANPNYTGGNYVFLRVNQRGEQDSTRFYQQASADSPPINGNPDINPTLTIDTVNPVPAVPEPASLALLGLGGLAMLGRRRRRA